MINLRCLVIHVSKPSGFPYNLGALWSHQISIVSNARWIPCCLPSSQNAPPALSLSHLLQGWRACLNPTVFQDALKSCNPLLSWLNLQDLPRAPSHAALQDNVISRETTFAPHLDNTLISSCPLTPLPHQSILARHKVLRAPPTRRRQGASVGQHVLWANSVSLGNLAGRDCRSCFQRLALPRVLAGYPWAASGSYLGNTREQRVQLGCPAKRPLLVPYF